MVRRATPRAGGVMHLFDDLITIPATVRFFLLSLLAMIALAALDIVGAMAAKQWSEHRHPLYFAGGLIAFGLLFAVYAKSLDIAELPIVTLGWVVCLQIGMTLIDRVVYRTQIPIQTWLVIAIIVLLQVYLMITQNARAGS
jgi:multidrug transporter EmrE-like cation transporter